MKLTKLAQQVLDKVKNGADVSDESVWNEEENALIQDMTCSDGFGYGITAGGYIDLSLIVEDGARIQKEIKEVFEIWKKVSVDI